MLLSSLIAGGLIGLLVKISGDRTFSPTRAFLIVTLTALALQAVQISITAAQVTSPYTHLKTPYQRLFAGLGFRLAKSFILGVLCILVFKYEFNLKAYVIAVGGAVFLLMGLLTTPLLRHLILRLSLYCEGAIPLRFATFLDYAADAGILEKDGGQWRFRHQNLQDFFGSPEYWQKALDSMRRVRAKKRGRRG